MRESCQYGSVRGDRGNSVPYRDKYGDVFLADSCRYGKVPLIQEDAPCPGRALS